MIFFIFTTLIFCALVTVDAGGRFDIKMDDSALKGHEIEMGITVYLR